MTEPLADAQGCTADLNLRLPIGTGVGVCIRDVRSWPLVAYLPPGWISPSASASGTTIECNEVDKAQLRREARSLLRAGAERIEHFPGDWLLRLEDGTGVTAVHMDGEWLYRSEGAQARHILVLRAPSAPTAESLVLRVLRDLLQHRLRREGYVLLHASVVSAGGRGIAFIGDKGAGKTAWMTRALAHGWDLVANDRVFVHPQTLDVVGFPIAAMLTALTTQHLPTKLRSDILAGRTLRQDHLQPGYHKIGLAPRELANAFNVEVAPNGALTEVRLLGAETDAGALLSRNVYSPRDPTYAFDLLFFLRFLSESAPSRLISVLTKYAQFMREDWATFDRTFHARLGVPIGELCRGSAEAFVHDA